MFYHITSISILSTAQQTENYWNVYHGDGGSVHCGQRDDSGIHHSMVCRLDNCQGRLHRSGPRALEDEIITKSF